MLITALVEEGVFTLQAALDLTPAQLCFFYEQHLRTTAARRATTVIDLLAAISALSDTEHVKQHLSALHSLALPEGASGSSYTTDSNIETIEL